MNLSFLAIRMSPRFSQRTQRWMNFGDSQAKHPSSPPPFRNLPPSELAEVGAYAATDMNRNQT